MIGATRTPAVATAVVVAVGAAVAAVLVAVVVRVADHALGRWQAVATDGRRAWRRPTAEAGGMPPPRTPCRLPPRARRPAPVAGAAANKENRRRRRGGAVVGRTTAPPTGAPRTRAVRAVRGCDREGRPAAR